MHVKKKLLAGQTDFSWVKHVEIFEHPAGSRLIITPPTLLTKGDLIKYKKKIKKHAPT